jgi:hypothetical protein
MESHNWLSSDKKQQVEENSSLDPDKRCLVSGNGTEDAYHATVTYTKADALRHVMRSTWTLPDKEHSDTQVKTGCRTS